MEDIKKLIKPRRYKSTKVLERFAPDEEHFASFIAAGYKIKQPASRDEWNEKYYKDRNYYTIRRHN